MFTSVRRGLLTLVVVLGVWELVARLWFPVYTLPPPSTVARTLWDITRNGVLWDQLKVSLVRVGLGYLLAAALAIPLGVVTGWWSLASQTVGSFLEILRPIPSLALIPLAIVWLGIGEWSKIAIIAYASFFSIYINTQAGVKNVDPAHLSAIRIYGRGTRDLILKVVAFSILPYVFTGLRYSASVAIILLVAVELVGSQSGLGAYLVQQQSFLQVPQMFAAIAMFGLLGFVANLVILQVEKRVIRWREDVTVSV